MAFNLPRTVNLFLRKALEKEIAERAAGYGNPLPKRDVPEFQEQIKCVICEIKYSEFVAITEIRSGVTGV